MTIELDHVIISSKNPAAAAKLLGDTLGVPWSAAGLGPFSPVYVSDSLTLDFIEAEEPLPVEHFCFRVTSEEFAAILGRLKAQGIPYRSTVRGPMDMTVNSEFGGHNVYWNEPDGHQWEMLTVSYARAPKP